MKTKRPVFVCLIVLILLGGARVSFAVKPESGCFDFAAKKVSIPLREPPKLDPTKDITVRGKKGDIVWAAGRGLVPTPIKVVYFWLLDHTQWKDMSKTELKVKELQRPGYVAYHEVDVELSIFAFISLSWQEQWAYLIRKGSPRAPEEVVVSYQKSQGTSHIRLLCGSIVIQKVDEGHTDVYFYEESEADRYKAEDIENMHVNNLKTLAKLRDLSGG